MKFLDSFHDISESVSTCRFSANWLPWFSYWSKHLSTDETWDCEFIKYAYKWYEWYFFSQMKNQWGKDRKIFLKRDWFSNFFQKQKHSTVSQKSLVAIPLGCRLFLFPLSEIVGPRNGLEKFRKVSISTNPEHEATTVRLWVWSALEIGSATSSYLEFSELSISEHEHSRRKNQSTIEDITRYDFESGSDHS